MHESREYRLWNVQEGRARESERKFLLRLELAACLHSWKKQREPGGVCGGVRGQFRVAPDTAARTHAHTPRHTSSAYPGFFFFLLVKFQRPSHCRPASPRRPSPHPCERSVGRLGAAARARLSLLAVGICLALTQSTSTLFTRRVRKKKKRQEFSGNSTVQRVTQ